MNDQRTQHVQNKGTASTVASSISSIILSVIASSHHWLHMGILLLFGSSTNMMAATAGVLWIRRVMVIATIITSIYSIYRLNKHKHMPFWMKSMSIVSILVSFGFIVYTLTQFGW